jgi:hypothetical protein
VERKTKTPTKSAIKAASGSITASKATPASATISKRYVCSTLAIMYFLKLWLYSGMYADASSDEDESIGVDGSDVDGDNFDMPDNIKMRQGIYNKAMYVFLSLFFWTCVCFVILPLSVARMPRPQWKGKRLQRTVKAKRSNSSLSL